MLTAILPDRSISSTSLNESVRPVGRPIAVAPVAPPTPVEASEANLQNQRPPQPETQYEPPTNGTTFAAAVLAGALTPTPTTLGELYARIGASAIPEGSELRLKNLQV